MGVTGKKLAEIFISILASPVRLGLYSSSGDPAEIVENLSKGECRVQDHVAAVYGRDASRASEMILEKCIKKNIGIYAPGDCEYPALLKEIHRPPLLIYVKGILPAGRTISIVGTRNSDRVSENITLRIASALAEEGYCIVSGMAYGIDRFAHLGALNSGGGTVGVLPGGIDTVYPYRNRDLYNMVYESPLSSLISEYPPGVPPGQKWTFSQRNRIISGISPALIVIQAPRGSGAMITAKYAIEQNRDLFACPGYAFDERYEGCHDLIRDGAVIVSKVEDILAEIDPEFSLRKSRQEPVTIQEIKTPAPVNKSEKSVHNVIMSYSGIERDILDALKEGPGDIDTFTRKFSYTSDQVSMAITVLEIDGILIRRGNNIQIKS